MPQIFKHWFDSEALETLPNMTLAMNTMDEPKVVVPHDLLSHALNAASTRHKLQSCQEETQTSPNVSIS